MENNLEIDVRNAKALGLSYGRYKALQYDPNAPRVVKVTSDRVCPACGKELPNGRFKYCSDECRESYNLERRRSQSRERYHRTKKKLKGVD